MTSDENRILVTHEKNALLGRSSDSSKLTEWGVIAASIFFAVILAAFYVGYIIGRDIGVAIF